MRSSVTVIYGQIDPADNTAPSWLLAHSVELRWAVYIACHFAISSHQYFIVCLGFYCFLLYHPALLSAIFIPSPYTIPPKLLVAHLIKYFKKVEVSLNMIYKEGRITVTTWNLQLTWQKRNDSNWCNRPCYNITSNICCGWVVWFILVSRFEYLILVRN